jgi:hypothetical protein
MARDPVAEVNPEVITDADGVEWMLLAAALPLFPANHPGKKVHINTLHRMIHEGRLEARQRRQGRRKVWYVRKDQVLAQSELEAPPARPTHTPAAERKAIDRWTRETLERMRPGKQRKAPSVGGSH